MLFWIVSNTLCVIPYHNLQLLLVRAVHKYWDAGPASISGFLKAGDACTAVLKMHKRGQINSTVFKMYLVFHWSCLVVRQILKKTNEASNNYYKNLCTSEKYFMVVLYLIFLITLFFISIRFIPSRHTTLFQRL